MTALQSRLRYSRTALNKEHGTIELVPSEVSLNIHEGENKVTILRGSSKALHYQVVLITMAARLLFLSSEAGTVRMCEDRTAMTDPQPCPLCYGVGTIASRRSVQIVVGSSVCSTDACTSTRCTGSCHQLFYGWRQARTMMYSVLCVPTFP